MSIQNIMGSYFARGDYQMNIVNSICTVIGMRSYAFPDRSIGREIDREINRMIHNLDVELRTAVCDGKIVFQCGMAMGADIWAAKTILKLRREIPQIQLNCFLPCETQANQWAEHWREPYFEVLGEADEVFCLQSHFSRGCYYRRNLEMLCNSSRVILLYGTKADGGINQAIDYCKSNEIETRIIKVSDSELSHTQADAPNDKPVIQFADYISSQTSSAYLAGLDIGISAIKRAWL